MSTRRRIRPEVTVKNSTPVETNHIGYPLIDDDEFDSIMEYRLNFGSEPFGHYYVSATTLHRLKAMYSEIETIPTDSHSYAKDVASIMFNDLISSANISSVSPNVYYKRSKDSQRCRLSYVDTTSMYTIHVLVSMWFSDSSEISDISAYVSFTHGECGNPLRSIDVEAVIDRIDELTKLVIEVKRPDSQVNMLIEGTYGLELLEAGYIPDPMENFQLDELYNEDFVDVYNIIIDNINISNESGIAILHGEPGTGKTSFIRHLIHKCDKRLIFFPPKMADLISSPKLIPFLREYKNSILIIEDAETILRTREAGENTAVSNLLNLGDGILGDILSIQVICTFNAPAQYVDPALFRDGRLIASYEFGPLSADKATKLSTKVWGDDACKTFTEPATLAQVFNKPAPKLNAEKSNTPFGFTP